MKLREVYEQQKNFWAGVILMALLVLVLGLSYHHKSKSVTSSGLVLYATYNKADGVNVGSSVRLAGAQVGRVTAASLDGFYRVQLTLTLDKGIELPSDTAAIIETDGLIGNKYIELLPGGDEELMKSGDSFIYTQDVLMLNELMERFIQWMRIKKGFVEQELIKGDN